MLAKVTSAGLPFSLSAVAVVLLIAGGVVWIAARARAELAASLRQRATLLDEAARLFQEPKVTISADGFPRLTGKADGRRVSLEVVADGMVPRRLPQLWLKATLHAPVATGGASIGVLARPAGTEFYSRVLALPETLRPSFAADFPLLMRGRDVTEATMATSGGLFERLFTDPTLKEVVATPHGCGLVRQIAQGERGAHLLYRQMRFPVAQVPAALVSKALAELDVLDQLAGAPATAMEPT